jgi:multiple sugar transport system ATP-binding protein
MASLRLVSLTKNFADDTHAVHDFDIEIMDGEFVVLLGPSGCGKSTVLRLIAGLEKATSGNILIDGRNVDDVSPHERGVAMVFQSFALYPHLTVYENMAVGLGREHSKEEIDMRVKKAAAILEIESLLYCKARVLSGGQRQRVGIGRAIVRNAGIYLIDEPLSNLDAQLRSQIRIEIIRLQSLLKATILYVTHDQIEAMTMATRVVVMKDGHIQQIGSPKEIYDSPKNMFVARFVGMPPMNFIEGVYRAEHFEVDGKSFKIPTRFHDLLKKYDGKALVLGIRPEDIQSDGTLSDIFPEIPFDFEVEVCELLGYEFILHGEFAKQRILAKVTSRIELYSPRKLKLAMDAAKLHFFDKETTQAIV